MLFQVIKKNYYIIILIFFSIGINQYFGNKGVFPVDSFAFFDTGFRVLNNQLPFQDSQKEENNVLTQTVVNAEKHGEKPVSIELNAGEI